MDKFAKSEYLQKLYDMHNSEHKPPMDDHECDCHCDREELTPLQKDNLKINVLHGITKHMCKKSIPCDDGCEDELMGDIDRIVDRYFVSKKGNLLQYFADTKNTVTDMINDSFEDAIEEYDPVDEDDERFITAVVDKVTNDEDVETVIKSIEKNIKKSAENDIKQIIDDVKDDEEDASDQNEMPTEDTNINESVFHHYLIKQYKENIVPDDPEIMLVTPMIETALHYVRRVLFSDGFAREMRENAK